MAYDTNNVFAKILRGEIPAVKIYEDEWTLAFLDVMPQAEGHTLVIPKEAVQNVFDLSSDGAASVMLTAQKVAKAIKRALNPAGVMLVQLNGEAAGQTVFHLHMHIIPRTGGAEFAFRKREMEDPSVLNAVAEKIKAKL